MSNIISIVEKLETWKVIYQKSNLQVKISSHGKFKFLNGNEIVQLEFFDSISFLKDLSKALESVMCSMHDDVSG